MTIFCYIRWSSLEQGKAEKSSEARQREAIETYARNHKFVIDEVLIDSGRSAFTGANLKNGNLGKLSQRILDGAIDSPVILVEHLDRLSRRPPADMMGWIVPLLQKGLIVHVAATGQVITIEGVNRDFGSFMAMMTAAFSAFEFSKKQQERGNAAWKRRREAAKAGQNISRHRSRKWLEWNPSTKSYDAIPERVALIEEMFSLRLLGHGKNGIAKSFNEKAKTNPHYGPWASTSRTPIGWTASAVGRIVQDIAVIGYVQYNKYPRGASRRIPLGEPLKVYPAIIDEGTFAKANTTRIANQAKHHGRGRTLTNLLGRAVKCVKCGGRATAFGSSRWRENKDGSISQHYYLYCNSAKQAKTCDNQNGYPYLPIERAALSKLIHSQAYDFPTDSENADRARGVVLSLEQQASRQEKAARNLLRMGIEDDDIATDEYQNLKVRLDDTRLALSKAKDELNSITTKPSPSEYIRRVRILFDNLLADDPDTRFEARQEVRAAIEELLRIDLLPDGSFTISV